MSAVVNGKGSTHTPGSRSQQGVLSRTRYELHIRKIFSNPDIDWPLQTMGVIAYVDSKGVFSELDCICHMQEITANQYIRHAEVDMKTTYEYN
jgi:hypothetical protein